MNTSRNKLLQTLELLSSSDCRITIHDVVDRQVLAAWCHLMDAPQVKRCGSTCYVEGKVGQIYLTVFYEPGLLGERVLSVEGDSDLEELLAEFAPACASVDLDPSKEAASV